MIYDSQPHAIVAISRHTECLRYYTVDLNDKLANLLLGNKVEFKILGDNDTSKVSVYNNNNYN